MSIASEITRINTNIAAAYTALDGKGATLPDTQNSANLADTIDTITTGGGGGGGFCTLHADEFNESEFNTYKSWLDNIVPDNYEGIWKNFSTSIKESFTVENENYMYSVGFWVLQFSPKIKQVVSPLTNTTIVAYHLPDDISIDLTGSGDNKCTITFNGNSRTIVLVTSTVFPYSFDNMFKMPNDTNNFTYLCAVCPVALYIKTPSGSNREIYSADGSSSYGYNIKSNFFSAYVKTSKAILPSNLKINLSSWVATANGVISSSFAHTFLIIVLALVRWGALDRLSEMDNADADGFFSLSSAAKRYAESTEPVTNASQVGRYILGSERYSSYKRDVFQLFALQGVEKIPFVIDLTGCTGTGTWDLNKAQSDDIMEQMYTAIKQARIKLPSTYTTIDMTLSTPQTNYGNDSYIYPKSLNLDLTSWQYMANNAPSITATIKVGGEVFAQMLQFTDWAAVKSTFESKGWTVSVI